MTNAKMLCCALLAAVWTTVGECAEPMDLVVLAQGRPVLMRMHILLDGKPQQEAHRAASEAYRKALFQYLDANDDGVLSKGEEVRLPSPSLALGGPAGATNVAFNPRVVDSNGDGKLDYAEFSQYYREFGDAAVHLATTPTSSVPANAHAELFKRLDADGDGRLTRAELDTAGKLMILDQDDDELITAAELFSRPVPVVPAPGMAIRPRAPNPSVLLCQWPKLDESIVRRIKAEYGDKVDLSPNRNADIEFTVYLGDVPAGKSAIELVRRNDPSIQIQPGAGGPALWLGDSRTILQLRVNEGRPVLAANVRRQRLDQFRVADIDRRGRLSLNDARSRSFFPQQFDLLDRNLDGQLTEAEVSRYVDQLHQVQSAACTTAVSILTADAGKTLFDLIDSNRDGRLSIAELRSSGNLLAQSGARASLSGDDLPRQLHIAIGLGQASFNPRSPMNALSPQGYPMLAFEWSPNPLVWFHKMDRNRDGYVSPREFLGPAETFRKLDRDGDGLISPQEAETAGR